VAAKQQTETTGKYLTNSGMTRGGQSINRFNPGQWSVLSFYVLSGFLMEHQFCKLSTTGKPITFYVDRLLRVFPVYAAVLLFVVFLAHPTWWILLINASLIPLNYSYFTGVPVMVGPAWSLACEAQFYLLVPLFVRAKTSTIRWLTSGSIVFLSRQHSFLIRLFGHTPVFLEFYLHFFRAF
jgi:peptidoglycan/LPS O-acetylase OafA/YrhL